MAEISWQKIKDSKTARWFKWTVAWTWTIIKWTATWTWTIISWVPGWILKIIREFFFAYEGGRWKPKTHKFWIMIFAAPAAIAIWLRIWEAWILFKDIYLKLGKDETIVQALMKFKDVIANGTPLSTILSVGLISALLGMATTAIGWYSWDKKIKKQKDENGGGFPQAVQ